MLIQFDQVSLKQNGAQILADISWSMEENDNWAILGLNGSGKTSLLKMVTGYYWPTVGKLSVLGETFGKTSIPELRKRIGWVSMDLQQRINSNELAEEIVLSGKFSTIGIWQATSTVEKETARQLLVDCGGETLIGKKFSLLSQGQRQTVLIARSLMGNPELLILDEPCNGLDLFARQELLTRINQMASKKLTNGLILVTHYIEEIPDNFNKILLIKDGNIFATGNREDILNESLLTDFYDKDVEIIIRDNKVITVLPK